MPIKYNHTTLETFLISLRKALDSDPTIINFWPEAELITITQEALLTFGALSGFWKNNIFIETVEAKRVYNIFSDINNITNISPSITYADIINWLNIDLIESISLATPTSNLFTLDELLKLIESKYNLFQLKTGLITSKKILNVIAQNNLVKVPNDVLDLIRLKYKYNVDGTDFEVIIRRSDEETIAQFDPEALTEEGVPQYYSTVYGSPNEILLYPIPTIIGTLEIIYTGTRDTINALAVTTVVNLPNNIVPYLKYGIEEDIYNKDSLLNNPGKAVYCNKRWNEGIAIGKLYTSILTAKGNNLPISTDALNKLDDYVDFLVPSSDVPSLLGLAGFNIFEIDTLPNSAINTISLLCIDNAPLPVILEDYIDIEIGYMEALINYCVHLCQFKCGVYNLALTNNYMEEFIKIAIAHNQRLANKGLSYETLMGKTKLEEEEFPKLVKQAA